MNYIQKFSHLHLSEIETILPLIPKKGVIFLHGTLGSGKTQLVQKIIPYLLGYDLTITSPTYTYYNKYENIYHFDLYRVPDYETFVQIGGEDILDGNDGLILLEWPDICASHIVADFEIFIETTENILLRDITIHSLIPLQDHQEVPGTENIQ